MKQQNSVLKTASKSSRRLKFSLFILWSIACIGIGYGIQTTTRPAAPQLSNLSGPYVVTGKPVQKDIRSYKSFIAVVEPINEVNIKPQVSGIIDDVLFENGSYVKEGDVLFVIDKRKYEANVQSAQADLDKANANVVQIQNDYNRQLKLYKDKFLPKAELEVAESNLAQAKAVVQQATANLKLAQLDLEYATVTAPINGHISKAFVTKGNYVDTSSTTLARIVQTNPVRIAFSVTDKERLENLSQNNKDIIEPVPMKLILSNGKEVEILPTKIFSNSETSSDTATMSVYAEYDNQNKLLLPGNVITLRIPDSDEQNVLVIPQNAILQDSNGKYVMKIDKENIAIQQYIDADKTVDDSTIVRKGLTTNDTIIVSGGQKVSTGQKVQSMNAE